MSFTASSPSNGGPPNQATASSIADALRDLVAGFDCVEYWCTATASKCPASIQR
jgi:hypothetical protein